MSSHHYDNTNYEFDPEEEAEKQMQHLIEDAHSLNLHAKSNEALPSESLQSQSHSSKRRNKKLARQSSKDGSVVFCPSTSSYAAPAPLLHGPRSWKNSRRSRSGRARGLPKKGGAGGKGVWGVPGSELDEAYEGGALTAMVVDENDPNYDSELSGNIVLKAIVPLEEVKKSVYPIVLEYFENGDTSEAAYAVEKHIPVKYRDMFVEQVIEIAMDHRPSHREMTSVLISDLYPHVITQTDITNAFQCLLANIGELMIDIPNVNTMLGNFIARAIADDCLPPKFLNINQPPEIIEETNSTTNQKSDVESSQEVSENQNEGENLAASNESALSRAHTLLSMKHGLVRLHNVWGVGGGLRPVKSITHQMHLLLTEFLSSGDRDEAIRCLRLLEVPHFHHELVYEAIVLALEGGGALKGAAIMTAAEKSIVDLLAIFHDAKLIAPDQMSRGFLRVFEDMYDIQMDVPRAYIILDRFVERCSAKGFLADAVLEKVPNRGRKRFVSEGDRALGGGGGFHKKI